MDLQQLDVNSALPIRNELEDADHIVTEFSQVGEIIKRTYETV